MAPRRDEREQDDHCLTTDIRVSHDIFTHPKIGLESPPTQDVTFY
jgi:hypothetical protein